MIYIVYVFAAIGFAMTSMLFVGWAAGAYLRWDDRRAMRKFSRLLSVLILVFAYRAMLSLTISSETGSGLTASAPSSLSEVA